MLTLTRRYHFSAAHRLWNPNLSEAENKRHYGPCVRLHGHNYTLEVTVTGTPDQQTGRIVHLEELDQQIQFHILDAVDHRYLDEDVAFLRGTLSTVENLAEAFSKRVLPVIPKPARLYRIRLYENDTNWTEWIADETQNEDTP